MGIAGLKIFRKLNATEAHGRTAAGQILRRALTAFSVLVFIALVLRTAWLSDDAYITFRTVDNFVNGYGLRWNVIERTQAYTNPLWMFLVTAPYYFTREIYYTSIVLSIAVSVASVLLLSYRIAAEGFLALLAMVILVSSKAFIDYSTSGLENPLSHLLFAFFFIVYFKREANGKNLLLLSLAASLGVLNRMDTLLLLFPPLVAYSLRLRSWRAPLPAAAGFLPFILWEAFSLFYYGFPFPNTAYAKLSTGINGSELARQGIFYLLNSLRMDPVTLPAILLALALSFLKRERSAIPVALGVLLYLIYIVRVGGDFMSGRFLAAPLFCSAVLLSCGGMVSIRAAWALVPAALIAGLYSPYPNFFSGADYRRYTKNWDLVAYEKGVTDERGFYFQHTGLFRADGEFGNSHPWAYEGLSARVRSPLMGYMPFIGFFGFYAGPNVHVIDEYALSEPFLARLPSERPWRIGHFLRKMPAGYEETLRSGQNRLADRNLAVYYSKLALITRGELFDIERLKEIWNMNTGKYDDLIP